MTLFGFLSDISFLIAFIAGYLLAFVLGSLFALVYVRKKIKKTPCPHCKEILGSL